MQESRTMRANLRHITQTALSQGRFVAAISVYDFMTAQGVVAGSEASGQPVILLVPPKAAAGVQGTRLIAALRVLANDAGTPVCVQLDHASDMELILSATEAGVDSVLVDGSVLPDDENSMLVQQARTLVDGSIVIEAELGQLQGDEDKAHGQAGPALDAGITDPRSIAPFLEASGADLLAVSVGNVHGHYAGEPNIQWKVLEAIHVAAGSVPLVLHGASGLPRADLRKAATKGIGKVNINTELRAKVFAVLEEQAALLASDGLNLLDLTRTWMSTTQSFTTALLADP
jgi:tagatose 1,6-diphosphate aldolase GatY/KbaY